MPGRRLPGSHGLTRQRSRPAAQRAVDLGPLVPACAAWAAWAAW